MNRFSHKISTQLGYFDDSVGGLGLTRLIIKNRKNLRVRIQEHDLSASGDSEDVPTAGQLHAANVLREFHPDRRGEK